MSVWRLYLPVTVLSGVLMVTLLMLTLEVNVPYTSDGVVYVEAGRNLKEGKGLVHTPFGLAPYQDETEPLIFKPGYSVAIAAVASLGLDPRLAALGISLVAWILLVPAVIFAFRPFIGDVAAATCALLVSFSPGLFWAGTRIYADTLFMLLVVMSLGLLFRAVAKNGSSGAAGFVISGFLASLAYLSRHEGVALLLAVLTAFVSAGIFGVLHAKQAVRSAVLWVVGLLPLVLTWVAVSPDRELATSGPGPDLIVSVRLYLWNLLRDLSGMEWVADFAWDYRILLFGLLPLILMIGWRLLERWMKDFDQATRFAVLTLGIYLAAGVAMVVIAIFLWDVVGKLRYVTRQSWIVLFFAIIATVPLLHQKVAYRRQLMIVGAAVVFLLVVGRATFVSEFFAGQERFHRKALSQDLELLRDVRNLPDDAYIASTLGSFLTFETERSVRNLPRDTLASISDGLKAAAVNVGRERGLYAVILPTTDMYLKKRDSWQSEFLSAMPSEYEVVKTGVNMILLKRRDGFSQAADESL